MAERIGLEPMDRYSRSQISNLLHYHSANAPIARIIPMGDVNARQKSEKIKKRWVKLALGYL